MPNCPAGWLLVADQTFQNQTNEFNLSNLSSLKVLRIYLDILLNTQSGQNNNVIARPNGLSSITVYGVSHTVSDTTHTFSAGAQWSYWPLVFGGWNSPNRVMCEVVLYLTPSVGRRFCMSRYGKYLTQSSSMAFEDVSSVWEDASTTVNTLKISSTNTGWTGRIIVLGR